MKQREKKLLSLIMALFMVVSTLAMVNIGPLAPVVHAAEKAENLSITNVKTGHVTDEMIKRSTYHEECDDADFKKLHSKKTSNGITTYALTETIADTGLFKSSLTGIELEIYQALESVNLTAQNNGIYFPNPDPDGDINAIVDRLRTAYKEALYSFEYDNLDKLYWQETNAIGMSYDGNTDTFWFYFRAFKEDSSDPGYTEAKEAQAKAKVSQAVSSLSGYRSVYDKLYYANKWVCDNCEYGYSDTGSASKQYYYAHSMMGLLIDGIGVCETYAKTFKILCKQLGLPCIVVISNSHAFNYVKIDGAWYMVDCTWNDGTSIYMRYFLCSNNPYIDEEAHVPVGPLTYPSTSKNSYQKLEHNWDAGTVTKKATCETAGTIVFHCTDSGCSQTKTEVIEALGHKYKFESSTTTCVLLGKDIYRCEYCDKTKSETSQTLLNHRFNDESEFVFNDTYTACDVYRTCEVCGQRFDLGDGTVEEISRTEPTCTRNGNVKYKVVYSFNEYGVITKGTMTEYVTIPATGHSYTKKTVAATCTTDGYDTYTCSVCKDSYTNNRKQALGHNYVETERVLPKDGVDGYIKYGCTRCNSSYINKISKTPQTIVVTKSGDENPLTEAVLNVGKTIQLSVDGAKTDLIYKSEDSKIATVSSQGLIEGVKPGLVKITVKAKAAGEYDESQTETIEIDVRPGVTSSLKASNVSTGIKLTWTKVPDVKGYYIYCDDKRIATASATAVSYTDKTKRTNGTKLKYKVVAYADNGKSASGKSLTTYYVLGPSISSLKNSAAKTMTVKYSKVSGNTKITGYQIQYATSSSFASAKTKTVSKNSTLSATIKSLTKGKTYYVRVRSYKKVSAGNYYSCWSAKKSLKITK